VRALSASLSLSFSEFALFPHRDRISPVTRRAIMTKLKLPAHYNAARVLPSPSVEQMLARTNRECFQNICRQRSSFKIIILYPFYKALPEYIADVYFARRYYSPLMITPG
jgi:hypothetical protein